MYADSIVIKHDILCIRVGITRAGTHLRTSELHTHNCMLSCSIKHVPHTHTWGAVTPFPYAQVQQHTGT